jgi:hypothetical protein
VSVLFADEVPVHYGFMFLSSVDDRADLAGTCRGQQNGLCGAAVPGVLSLTTGLHTGRVSMVVEWFDAEPTVDPQWEEVVEASFAPAQADLVLSSFQDSFELRLPAVTRLRVRYCACGMDAAHQRDTVSGDEPTVDRYLLQLWPSAQAPDAVVRQTSAQAAYWHRTARALPPPPTAAEREAAARAQAERNRLAAQRAPEESERRAWGGRSPSPRLRELGGYVFALAESHRDLLDTFEAWDPDTQRTAARWLARRAFEIAGLDRVDWARAALDAMDRGAALPFADEEAAFSMVHNQPSSTFTAAWVDAAQQRSPVHRPSFAIPAIFSAVHPDPLQALVDTFTHAEATFDDQRDTLLADFRQRFVDV